MSLIVAWLPHPWLLCLEEAWESRRQGSIPIGAVVLDAAGKVLARGRNRTMGPAGQTPVRSPASRWPTPN